MDRRPKKVFISYSRKDSQMADAIRDVLAADAIETFVDREGIKGAEDFTQRLTQEIHKSDLLLFLASANSFDSKFVKKELLYAIDCGIKILPYFVDDAPLPEYIKFLIGDVNWLKASDCPVGPELIKAVNDAVSKGNLPINKAGVPVMPPLDKWKRILPLFLFGSFLVFLLVSLGIYLVRYHDSKISKIVEDISWNVAINLREVDSLRVLGQPETTISREAYLLNESTRQINELDSIISRIKKAEARIRLEDDNIRLANNLKKRRDSTFKVWKDQAQTAISLYEQTGLDTELYFARSYLHNAAMINKNDKELQTMLDRL